MARSCIGEQARCEGIAKGEQLLVMQEGMLCLQAGPVVTQQAPRMRASTAASMRWHAQVAVEGLGQGLEAAAACVAGHSILTAAYLKEREWGQMGVKRMAGTLGCTMLPPAATE